MIGGPRTTGQGADVQRPAPVEHTFSTRRVTPDQRRALIRAMFDRIAGRYDLMNDLMSLGIHRRWKRVLVETALRDSPGDILDLAAGTGDIALRLRRRAPDCRMTACDASRAMLDVCATRVGPGVAITHAEAESLPYGDDSFDAVTLAFGLRNMTDIDGCLSECLRVLRPGGRLHCLEFSTPAWWLRHAYGLHSRTVIPVLGWAIAGDRQAYDYLVTSIRRFPDQAALCERFRKVGYRDVSYRNLSFGIAAIHSAAKP